MRLVTSFLRIFEEKVWASSDLVLKETLSEPAVRERILFLLYKVTKLDSVFFIK